MTEESEVLGEMADETEIENLLQENESPKEVASPEPEPEQSSQEAPKPRTRAKSRTTKPRKRRAPAKKQEEPPPPQGIAGILAARAKEVTESVETEIWQCAADNDRYTYVAVTGAYGNRNIQRVKPGAVLRVSAQDRQAYCQEYSDYSCPYLNGRLEPLKVNQDFWDDFSVVNVVWDDLRKDVLQESSDSEFVDYAKSLTSRETVKRLIVAAEGAVISVEKADVLRRRWDEMNRPKSVFLDAEGRQRIASTSPDEEQSSQSGSILTSDPNSRRLPKVVK